MVSTEINSTDCCWNIVVSQAWVTGGPSVLVFGIFAMLSNSGDDPDDEVRETPFFLLVMGVAAKIEYYCDSLYK